MFGFIQHSQSVPHGKKYNVKVHQNKPLNEVN